MNSYTEAETACAPWGGLAVLAPFDCAQPHTDCTWASTNPHYEQARKDCQDSSASNGKGCWIGLKQTDLANGQPAGDSDQWQWANNERENGGNWANGQPNGGQNENCAEVWKTTAPGGCDPGTSGNCDGKWHDIPCAPSCAQPCTEQGRPALCNTYGNKTITPKTLPGCEGNVSSYEAINLNENGGHSWENMKRQCAQYGQVAIIKSAADNLKAWNLCKSKGGKCIIGLHQNEDSPTFSEPAGRWEWDGGSTCSYRNWAEGQPGNDGSKGESFAAFYEPGGATGKWHDSDTMEWVICSCNKTDCTKIQANDADARIDDIVIILIIIAGVVTFVSIFGGILCCYCCKCCCWAQDRGANAMHPHAAAPVVVTYDAGGIPAAQPVAASIKVSDEAAAQPPPPPFAAESGSL